jgi:hypothetical protein
MFRIAPVLAISALLVLDVGTASAERQRPFPSTAKNHRDGMSPPGWQRPRLDVSNSSGGVKVTPTTRNPPPRSYPESRDHRGKVGAIRPPLRRRGQ